MTGDGNGKSGLLVTLWRDAKAVLGRGLDWWRRRRRARWQRVVVSLPIANPDLFEGRSAAVKQLKERLLSCNVVWVTGPPGVGKSALAGKCLHEDGKAALSRSFELSAGTGFQDVLESINAFLLERGCNAFEACLRDPGLGPQQRIPGLLRALAQTDGLLVIESYEEVADDDEMPKLIREAEEHLSGAKVIVTSQQPPEWEIEHRRVRLGGLDPEGSRRVLAALGVSEGWERIHTAVDGCPKGLHVAAWVAKTYGVEEAVRSAARGESPALGLFGEVYGRLPEAARRMWSMLAMLPGPFERESVLALWGEDNGATVWADLVDAAVLDQRGDRWQMHSLARATGGRERVGEKRWRKHHAQRIAGYYAQFAKEKAGDATLRPCSAKPATQGEGESSDTSLRSTSRAAVEGQLENVLAAARLAFRYREWEALWGMGGALDDPLDYAGRWTAREELLRLCYDAAGEAKDKQRRVAFAHNLGIALQQRGKLEEAEGLYRQSLEIEREVGNRPREAISLHQLGNVAYLRGKLEDAEGLYRQSLGIVREVGDRPGEAQTLHQLGIVAQDRGKLEEAEDFYNQSLKIEREVGDRPGEAQTLHQLGIVAQDRGKLEEAEELYRQSLGIAREVGNMPGEASTLHQLGMVAQDRDKLEEAEGFYNQSLKIEREVGDRPGEAKTLAQIALLAEAQGGLGPAVERTEEALSIFDDLRLPESQRARQQLERLRKRLAEDPTSSA